MRKICFWLLFFTAVRPLLGAGSTTAPADIANIILGLGDPDPAVRQQRADDLVSIGLSARPELVKASRSPSPQISARAAEILMKMQWWKASDPPEVRNRLLLYGNYEAEGRIRIIKGPVPGDQPSLANIPGSGPVLVRLMQEDPSDAVAWAAANALRGLAEENTYREIRRLDLSETRAPLLALAGLAYLETDQAKCDQLLRRAIDQDATESSANGQDLDFAYRLLVADAVQAGNTRDAAAFLRTRARRAAGELEAQLAVFSLFALYADCGPTDELSTDLQEFSAFVGLPEVMYALARIHRQSAGSSSLVDLAIGRAAFAASLASPEAHLRCGSVLLPTAEIRSVLLLEPTWCTEVRDELDAAIAFSGKLAPRERMQLIASSHLLLAQAAELNADHTSVAEHIDAAFQSVSGSDLTLRNPDKRLMQANWHRLHAARDAKDAATAQDCLDKLIGTADPDADVAIEVVSYLKELGRKDEAQEYFQRAYLAHKFIVNSSPTDATPKNDFAWLCACCGEHLDEAIAAARRATMMEPTSYSYIDTAATAQFAIGNFAEAVRLEKRALAFCPAEPFMHRQLQRFQQAAGIAPTTQPNP